MQTNKKKILVTGAAGFIGFHTVHQLLKEDFEITGLDNINSYYDPKLKYDRLALLGIENPETGKSLSTKYQNFGFYKTDITDSEAMKNLFKTERFDIVIHLAAQAGVRYSIEAPAAYVQANISGFLNILECCKDNKIEHLIYASSSSVYGNNQKVPFSESDAVDHPVSMYAATKKSNELMAHTYSHIHKLATTGLRFFTVYGPWGRPDMAPYLFTNAILNRKPIKVFNNGDLYRDFTFITDIVDGIILTMKAGADTGNYALYNIGNNKPALLMDFISIIEKYTGEKAVKEMLPMQQGDVYKTYADISALQNAVGYFPKTDLDSGMEKYVKWFVDYYKKSGE